MLKLSKKDRRIFWGTVIICLVLSYCLKSIFSAKNEFIITILTVIIGFILSAIAIIFSSSFYKSPPLVRIYYHNFYHFISLR